MTPTLQALFMVPERARLLAAQLGTHHRAVTRAFAVAAVQCGGSSVAAAAFLSGSFTPENREEQPVLTRPP